MTTAIETKERPILFSGEMVRAILDGRKTQTRRVVKPQPPYGVREIKVGMFEPVVIRGGMEEPGKPVFGFADEERGWKCKYGQPGDRLWVRETHYVESAGNEDGSGLFVMYKASDCDAPVSKWTPSIHMPRWASRITLEITGVRVERLNDISEEDCYNEGCQPEYDSLTAIQDFRKLWESINGKGSWSQNPWVWVVEFKRVIAA